ncbi:AAA family ATPase [Aeromicrobium sp. 636]|uniref:DNA 3'-5' helicase n=1 Tax=Aeromicrobium senzhongii TaxID=2663859 RepID=A0A8I0K120_9ACTN|nr:ATP-dependent DNA helicase [Aeromicrobium sp. 636]MBC9226433.1 ATP-dependent helicase [Aeromicrobium senzhongii]MCQ3998538.1 AAA family ATPase [Aeromicrobium sp. 636]
MTPLVRDTDHLKTILGIPFSAEQLGAITADPALPQAIIAGAGAGKTAVMAARVVWLVGHLGYAPDRLLGLTFTSKAAAELAGRVRDSLDKVGDFSEFGEPTVSTYHAFAGTLIAEHGLRMGIEPDLRVLADATRFQIAARVARGHDGPLRHVSAWLPTVIGDLLDLDGQLSEHLVTTEELRRFDQATVERAQAVEKPLKWHDEIVAACLKRDELADLVDEYRAAKADAGVMDFSDQMAWGAQLATLPEVQQVLRERYDVVLLDEYQDTSVAQRDLLQSLFAGRPISAVGDPAQGIYGWRGAASGNLTAFLDDFPGADGEKGRLFSLDVTRRCAPEIIDLAGYVAREYYGSPGISDIVTPLRAAPENPQGEVSVALHTGVAEEIEALVELVVDAVERGVPRREIAVLVRTTNENPEIVRALRSRGLPVEIVGLTGLLQQPEVVDVLSVLAILDDVTANPALLRLLTGVRWRIGERDLALLGQRAAELGRMWRDGDQVDSSDPDAVLQAALDEATTGVDPTEIVSLAEAVEDPGDRPYSEAARRRFADLASMLRRLRRHAHEPLLDLARRVVTELDLDVELPVAGVPTDNLALLMDAIGDYAQHDRYASLPGLLAHLDAEREYNEGMELSAPSDADSIKLLTIHRAKGLEFEEVFVPFVSGTVFPSGRGRSRWPTVAKALPAPLRGDVDFVPQIAEFTSPAKKAFEEDTRRDALMEEIRLAYVAFTRAKRRLHVSGHRWGRTQLRPRAESAFLVDVRDWLAHGGVAPITWAEPPADDDQNPHLVDQTVPWPVALTSFDRRRALADAVRQHLSGEEALPVEADPRLTELRTDLDLLLEEARARAEHRVVVDLPASLSATDVLALAQDEEAFVASLARPMPRRPSAAARFGTRFHAWIEARYGQQTLLDPDELPGRGDAEVADESDLDALKEAFESGPFAGREPVAVETPFTLRLGGQQIIGRIDAVFAVRLEDGSEGFEVVDWKTNRVADADELQLALYRLAWAELQGIEPERVVGTFHYVRLGESHTFADLPDREALETRLGLR